MMNQPEPKPSAWQTPGLSGHFGDHSALAARARGHAGNPGRLSKIGLSDIQPGELSSYRFHFVRGDARLPHRSVSFAKHDESHLSGRFPSARGTAALARRHFESPVSTGNRQGAAFSKLSVT